MTNDYGSTHFANERRWIAIRAVKEMFEQLIDNDTLIIIVAFMSPEHRQLIVGGLLGYMGKKAGGQA